MPRRSRRHHHELHEAVGAGCATALGLMFAGGFFVALWFYEAVAWMTVWIFYGTFLGLLWGYRHNVAGRAWTALTRRRHRSQPARDARPVDLATWQQQIAAQDPYHGRGVDTRPYGTAPTEEPPAGGMRRRGRL